MQFYTKKKVEIVIVAPLMERIIRMLDDLGCSGYTVLRAISGKGNGSYYYRVRACNAAGCAIASTPTSHG